MTQTNYRVIGFGKTEHGFFNQFAFCGTIGNACAIYDDHLQNPEMDGAVIIRVNHEDWAVIQEFCSESYTYSVIFTAVGTFRVDKSPELVLL
jgi:hypothetical protein